VDAKKIRQLKPVQQIVARDHSPVLRKIPWEKFHIKDTTKGPIVWEAKSARFYLKRDGLPDSYSLFGTHPVLMANRPSGREILGTKSRNYYVNTTSHSAFSPLPYKEKAEAIA